MKEEFYLARLTLGEDGPMDQEKVRKLAQDHLGERAEIDTITELSPGIYSILYKVRAVH